MVDGVEFGQALKSWRHERRLSQLDLGLSANVSARHISFLETGRARPSRGMVLRLCDELGVPRASRNGMLTMAGLAPAYRKRPLSEADMQPVRDAVDWMLERHAPYPAIAVDRHWLVVGLNRPAAMLLGGIGLGEGDSLIGALATNERFRQAIDNLDEVVALAVGRLRIEIAHLGGDAVLETYLADLLDRGPTAPFQANGVMPPFIPTRYKAGESTFALFSTMTQFGTTEDIALAELRIEMMFPADKATRELLNQLGS